MDHWKLMNPYNVRNMEGTELDRYDREFFAINKAANLAAKDGKPYAVWKDEERLFTITCTRKPEDA